MQSNQMISEHRMCLTLLLSGENYCSRNTVVIMCIKIVIGERNEPIDLKVNIPDKNLYEKKIYTLNFIFSPK